MKDFLVFARRTIRDRARLGLAMVFALLAAGGMGAGVMALIPAIKLIVNKEEVGTLPGLAARFNEAGREFLGMPIRIPAWLIEVVPADRLGGVVFVVAFIAILTPLGAAANFLHQYLSITVVARTIAFARMEIFNRAVHMPLARVNTRGASEFVARIIRDTAAVQRGLISLMSKAVAQSTQGLVLFVVALFVGRSLTLAALVILPLLAIFLRKMGKRIRRGTRGALKGQEDLLRIASETIQGLRAVKANTGEAESLGRFDVMNQNVVRQELRARVARAISGPVVETIAVLSVGGLAILAAREIIADRLTIERFVLALGALAAAGSKFKLMAGLVNEMQAASAPARRLLDVLEEPVEDDRAVAELPRHRHDVRFEGVTFSYPGADRPAVQDVTLEIPHGMRVAIVGPNGCGKTTLLSLVPRLLVPDRGHVRIDGVDVNDVSLASLRRQVAVVTQETMLFRGTIAENIAFGAGPVPRSAVIDAAHARGAHEFIERLPRGYDADVSEQGASLSGGQRQRLAIARAILRDPSLLILDEATSQIDAESEAHINAAIAEFCRGRTVLLIAHRLATVLDADRIVVMDQARVVDSGRHDELLPRCPLYRRLSQTQLIAAG